MLPHGQDMVLPSLSALGRTSINLSLCFISLSAWIPATACCLTRLEFFHTSPHQPSIAYTFTEMVETAVDACQLNTSRRIFAEIQLRINGFNTYG